MQLLTTGMYVWNSLPCAKNNSRSSWQETSGGCLNCDRSHVKVVKVFIVCKDCKQ